MWKTKCISNLEEQEREKLILKHEVKVKSLSRVQHFVTPWTVPYQAPLSTGFSRQ